MLLNNVLQEKLKKAIFFSLLYFSPLFSTNVIANVNEGKNIETTNIDSSKTKQNADKTKNQNELVSDKKNTDENSKNDKVQFEDYVNPNDSKDKEKSEKPLIAEKVDELDEIKDVDLIADLTKKYDKSKENTVKPKKPTVLNNESLKKYTKTTTDSYKKTKKLDKLIKNQNAKYKKKKTKHHVITAHPMPYAKMTSGFGYRRIFRKNQFHKGVDFAAKYGSPIYAAGDGRVVISGWLRGYGRVIYIDHGNGLQTRYAHNSKLLVRKGQFVKAGQIISKMGCSGRCTGPHLHFEVRINGKAKNPYNYLPK